MLHKPIEHCLILHGTPICQIYTLSLHDALPIYAAHEYAWFIIALSIIAIIYVGLVAIVQTDMKKLVAYSSVAQDRKSTRLNSSHSQNSYVVFCLIINKSATSRSQE